MTPSDFGLKTLDFSKIAGSQSAQGNARRMLEVLTGRYDTPEADFFCMNAAADFISRALPIVMLPARIWQKMPWSKVRHWKNWRTFANSRVCPCNWHS